ncbi:MATE family efflux transporter [Paenibacillus faecalis]|uniref:MATE family efflux transporter n=1 Tax=Paenibacillus faecalis TaxID=2079532 RepID=UPI000D0EE047|nr:MATE family efflux transporter [Paenibacillus faecalis]
MKNKELTYFTVLWMAIPLIFNTIINFSFTIADSIMIAPLGEKYLGAIGQGGIFLNVILTPFIGILGMFTPLVSRIGKENKDTKQQYLVNSVYLAFFLGVLIFFILNFTSEFFTLFNQPIEIVTIVDEYISTLKWSVFIILIYNVMAQMIIVNNKMKVLLMLTLIGNILNILLNWLLIYGNWGFPEYGVIGSAIATNISRMVMLISAISLIYIQSKEKIAFKNFAISLKFIKALLIKGVPKGITNLNDWLTSFILVLMVGWGGINLVAANQVTDLISSVLFMVPQAFYTVIVVRLSDQIGKGEASLTIKATAKKIILVSMTSSAIVIGIVLLTLEYIFSFFSIQSGTDTYLLSMNIMIVHLVFYLIYTIQYSLLAVLDSFLDTKLPSLITLVISYLFIIPAAYLMYKLGYSAVGIWVAEGIGMVIISILFLLRIVKIMRKNTEFTENSISQ